MATEERPVGGGSGCGGIPPGGTVAVGLLVAAPIGGDQSAAVAWGRGVKGIALPLLV